MMERKMIEQEEGTDVETGEEGQPEPAPEPEPEPQPESEPQPEDSQPVPAA
jgi:hypothetical protein